VEPAELLDGLLPPKDRRQRRYWRIGLSLGGLVMAIATFFVLLGARG
jgi:hypothetical protein